ncbi:MAG TPA: tyrosine-type recombinase/integrase, partial [Ignavibacteria bacterium]
MATTNFFVSGKKRKLVPVYVRLSAGRGIDLIVKSGFTVNPKQWSNDTQTIKQRIRTDDDDKFIKNLSGLKEHIESEIRNHTNGFTKDWLTEVIYKYHNKKSTDAKTLNDYIAQFIAESDAGDRKNKDAMDLAPGTVKAWKGFQRIFNEYQGIYTDKRIKWHTDNKKPLRPVKKIDFENITIDFYNSFFLGFLTDEGYKRGTIGRFIKELKMFMLKAIEDGLHNNRQFEYSAFKGITSKSFSVYLTKSELEKMANIDLSGNLELDQARDIFLVLCETALRISDYKKVDVSIRKSEDGTKLIYLTQTKTKGSIVIPCSARLEKVLKKYDNKLPKLPDQYINRRIKIVAQLCGIDEVQIWPEEKYGKTFEKSAPKYELITCHTGRRTACSLMYLAGIPTISIMQISGHKTEKIFLNYIKVTPEENARKLSLHPYFTGLAVVS